MTIWHLWWKWEWPLLGTRKVASIGVQDTTEKRQRLKNMIWYETFLAFPGQRTSMSTGVVFGTVCNVKQSKHTLIPSVRKDRCISPKLLGAWFVSARISIDNIDSSRESMTGTVCNFASMHGRVVLMCNGILVALSYLCVWFGCRKLSSMWNGFESHEDKQSPRGRWFRCWTELPRTAMRVYALFVKDAIRQQRVPEFSGGWLLPLYKGKGDPRALITHRGILLEPVMARCFSKAWRKRMAAALGNIAEPEQWGGRSGVTCTALHLQLRMWQSNARCEKRSRAIIYVDIRAAFYSIAKPLVASEKLTENEFQKLCATIGVPESAQGAFKTDAILQATGSPLCAAMARESLKTTWFIIPDGREVQSPSTGCRPGDPLADLFFTAVISFVLEEIHTRLADAVE